MNWKIQLEEQAMLISDQKDQIDMLIERLQNMDELHEGLCKEKFTLIIYITFFC